MIKRKKSLVPKLVAGVLLCTAFTSVSPLEAHASTAFDTWRAGRTEEQLKEDQAAHERAHEATQKANAQVYKGEDGLLHRKSDGSVITGTAEIPTARSEKSIYQGNITMGILSGNFLKDKTDYYKDACRRYDLDYDALVKEYYASVVTGEYPTMQKGWSKNAAGQWFYSEDGVNWYKGWLHDKDGKWYYLFQSGLMATNWDEGNTHLGPNGASTTVPSWVRK